MLWQRLEVILTMADDHDRLIEAELSIRENTRRIEKLEQLETTIEEICLCMQEMRSNQSNIASILDSVSHKVEVLEHIPARRWNGMVEKALTAVVSALVTLVLTAIFNVWS
ncbi:MAG: hypothetical protein H6Q60_1309 [Oscillospiraceae bacterium]|nr:hypothetical protein [Oscillospiraceae bacterium]